MPGCNCEKENFLTAYNDEVATIRQVNPTWDEHVVRLSAAQILRPRFKADMDSKTTEESDLSEYKVKDEFTLTADGAMWIGYGRRMEELEERTQSLTPGKYTASDAETTSAIESALRNGARRIVTSYARPGDSNRDLLVIEYNPDTNRGTMTIINTATNGNRHDFESMQQAAKERFADLELNRTSQTTFLLTDIKLPKDQSDFVHQDAHAISAIKLSDITLRNQIDNKRDSTDDRFNRNGQKRTIVIQAVDTAWHAGRKTVSEVGITLRRVREAIQKAKAKQDIGKQAVNKDVIQRSTFIKNLPVEPKRTTLEEKDQVQRARNSQLVEGNKTCKESISLNNIEKREAIFIWKKQKKSFSHSSSDGIIFARGEQNRAKRRKIGKTEAGISLRGKTIITSKELLENPAKKKGKLRLSLVRFENKKMKMKEYGKAGFIRKGAEKSARFLPKEKTHKREKQYVRALVTVARMIERWRRLERVQQESRKPRPGREKKTTGLSFLDKQRLLKEKQTDTLLTFSFAWILWMVTKTERNFIRPPLEVYPEFAEGQKVALKKQDETDHKNNSLIERESTPWLLLSIIWYLTMLREAGVQSSNQQSIQSNQHVVSIVLPVVPIRHQGIIFAYHS